jgi:hypothetical protein
MHYEEVMLPATLKHNQIDIRENPKKDERVLLIQFIEQLDN